MTERAKQLTEWLNHYIKTDPAHKVIARRVFGHNGDCGNYGEDWMWLDDICKQVADLIESLSETAERASAKAALCDSVMEDYEKLRKQLEQVTRERDAAVDAMPKWVSVFDVIPEKFKDVLACDENGNLGIVQFFDDNKPYEMREDGWTEVEVHYWMYIPELPEEDA